MLPLTFAFYFLHPLYLQEEKWRTINDKLQCPLTCCYFCCTYMIIKQNFDDVNLTSHITVSPPASKQAAAPECLWGGRSHSFTFDTALLLNGLCHHYRSEEVVISECLNGEMEEVWEGGEGGGGARFILHNSTCVASKKCMRQNLLVFLCVCIVSNRVGRVTAGWRLGRVWEMQRRDIFVSATFCFMPNCFNFVRPQQKGQLHHHNVVALSDLQLTF